MEPIAEEKQKKFWTRLLWVAKTEKATGRPDKIQFPQCLTLKAGHATKQEIFNN